MKYSDKYPNAQRGFEPTDTKDDMLYVETGLSPCANINVNDVDIEKHPTSQCPNLTQWRDLAWGCSVPCCSEECRAQMWKDYFTTDAAIAAGTKEIPTSPKTVLSQSLAAVEASLAPLGEAPASAPATEDVAAPVPSSEAAQ